MAQPSSPLQPSRPGNLSDSVIERLRDAILDGRYVPGQRLIESDLIEDLGSSRGPVREALRRLGAEGVVDLVPNRGAIVKKLSTEALIHLFRIREALEGLAAALAAEHVRDHGKRAACDTALLATGYGAAPAEGVSFSEANRLFHQLIVDFSGNEQLDATLKQMRIPLARLHIRAAINEAYRRQSLMEHDAVANAILAGDPEAAEAAMRLHLRNAGQRVVALAATEAARNAA